MITIQKIREDLKEIRYYYAKQKEFEGISVSIPTDVQKKTARYNKAIQSAPIRLYDLYIARYVNNNTQETVSYDWDCTLNVIKRNEKRLQHHFLNVFQSEEGLSE